MTVNHETFTIERTFDAPADRVFAAFADPEQKARWFVGPPSVKETMRTHDFRVGGRDKYAGDWDNGMKTSFDSLYLDIVPNQRVIYTYEMSMNGKKTSVSLATIELTPKGSKTTITLTEQGAYFDDPNANKGREEGTIGIMKQLEALFTK